MVGLSEYYGDGAYSGYTAKVFIEDEVPVVEFWRDKEFIAVRSFPDHTIGYAEDAAENFIRGILKL